MGSFTTAAKDWAVGSPVTETDLDGQVRDLINGFGAWTAYTPTWTGTTNPANFTAAGAYCRIGKLVHFYATFTMTGSTTFGSGAYSVSLPAAIASGTKWTFAGQIARSSSYRIFGHAVSGTTCSLNYISATSSVLTAMSQGAPVTLTQSTSDWFSINGTYEAA